MSSSALQVLRQYVDTVVFNVTDVDQVIACKRYWAPVIHCPHVGREGETRTQHDWIQAETNVRQSAACEFPVTRNLAVRKRTLARCGRCTIATVRARVSAKSGEWVESIG